MNYGRDFFSVDIHFYIPPSIKIEWSVFLLNYTNGLTRIRILGSCLFYFRWGTPKNSIFFYFATNTKIDLKKFEWEKTNRNGPKNWSKQKMCGFVKAFLLYCTNKEMNFPKLQWVSLDKGKLLLFINYSNENSPSLFLPIAQAIQNVK